MVGVVVLRVSLELGTQKITVIGLMQDTGAELPYCFSPWSRSAINVTSFEATNSPASGSQLWMAVPNFNGVAIHVLQLVEEYFGWLQCEFMYHNIRWFYEYESP